MINRVENWVCPLLYPNNGSAPQIKQHSFVLQKDFFLLIWLRFLKREGALKTGITLFYFLSFVAKWSFLILAQLAKLQGFGVAFFVLNLTCINEGK